MKTATLFPSLLLAAIALASPTPTLQKRSQTQCGQYESIVAQPYTLFTDLWGESAGTGSQCSTLNNINGNDISWSTNWTWSNGPYNVKSYTNVGLSMSSTQVSKIKSLPTKWSWTYTGNNLIADVAYDMFTSASAGGSNQYEVMVWLDALGGAGPISSTGSPIATPAIGGHTWNLSKGPNGQMTVFSFVAQTPIKAYSGDLLDFFKYLESSQGFSSSQYLLSVQAGTEPFTGSDGVLTTSAYSVAVQT